MAFIPTSFLGRDADLRALDDLFSSGQRLVTVLGPGGIGKTRLAERYVETASRFACSFFADCTDAKVERDAATIAAHAIAITPTSIDPTDQLGGALGGRDNALLVFDNVEGIAQTLPLLLDRLMAAAPRASFLVTSRVALRMPDEALHELGPLGASEAAALWRERSQTEIDDALLAKLLLRLDGHPLAIELTAPRARKIDPNALLAMLEERTPLASVIETSWNALSPTEQTALARMTVFAGTFSGEAAAAVSGANDGLMVTTQLRDHSMLSSPEAGRMVMLESVRVFADARLTAADRSEAIVAHAAFHGAVAHRILADRPKTEAEHHVMAKAIAQDRMNFERVIEHAKKNDECREAALHCVAVLDLLHPAREADAELVSWIESTAERFPTSLSMYLSGCILRRSGQHERARDILTRAVLDCEPWLREDAAFVLGTVRFLLGDCDGAEVELSHLLTEGSPGARARANLLLGQIRAAQGRFREARAATERGTRHLSMTTDTDVVHGHLCLVDACVDLADNPAAREALAVASTTAQRLGDRRLRAVVLNVTGWLIVSEGHANDAIAVYEEAFALVGSGHPLAGHFLSWRGIAFFAAGRDDEAQTTLERALPNVHAAAPRAMLQLILDALRARSKIIDWQEAYSRLERIDPPTLASRAVRDLLLVWLEVEFSRGAAHKAALSRARELLDVRSTAAAWRIVANRLEASLHEAPRLEIQKAAEWFAFKGTKVSLVEHPLLRRILLALATAQKSSTAMSIADLFEVGWEGERASGPSIEDRVRATIRRLRRAGLEELIEAHEGGFRFAPGVTIDIVE